MKRPAPARARCLPTQTAIYRWLCDADMSSPRLENGSTPRQRQKPWARSLPSLVSFQMTPWPPLQTLMADQDATDSRGPGSWGRPSSEHPQACGYGDWAPGSGSQRSLNPIRQTPRGSLPSLGRSPEPERQRANLQTPDHSLRSWQIPCGARSLCKVMCHWRLRDSPTPASGPGCLEGSLLQQWRQAVSTPPQSPV